MKRLEGEVAIIAGGSGDMGSSVSKLFLQEGANVVVGDIRPPKTKSSSKFVSEELDCTQKDSWDQVVSKTIELFGKVTILVNCFGANFRESFKDQGLSNWSTIININLTSVFIGIKAVMLPMQKAKKGSIDQKLKEIEKNTKEGGSVHFIAHGVNGNVIFNNSIFF